MNNFIPIPSTDGTTRYIKAFDIVNMCQYDNGSVEVYYKYHDRVCSLTTLLTPLEIDEAISNMQDPLDFIFGTDGE